MTSFRRRAIMLTQVMLMLPLIATIFVVVFELTTTSIRLQGRERQLLEDEAMMRDLARRIRVDARQAEGVRVEEEKEGGTELKLTRPGQTITYQASGGKVVRIEQAQGESSTRYAWTLSCGRARFQTEHLGAARDLVWTSFRTIAAVDRGPVPKRQLAFAATIGQGGES